MNIFYIPLYYISFSKKPILEKKLIETGFTNINHFNAIKGKELDEYELIQKKIISSRSFNDLKEGRKEHSGIPSKGAIGCSMSHMNLWKKCVDENLPYIIICEDDVKIKSISKKDIQKITSILESSDKSGFISTSINKDPIYQFWGLHFCIFSKGACKELIDNFYPIDLQADYYVAHLATLKR